MQHLPIFTRARHLLAQISPFGCTIIYLQFPKHLIDCDSSSDIANQKLQIFT